MIKLYTKSLIFLLSIIFFSCSKELTEEQKVFLDFAILEDTYSGRGNFHNLDLHSNYDEEPFYVDSIFSFEKFKKELKESFKLTLSESDNLVSDFSKLSNPIQYPFRIDFTNLKPNTYNVKFSIFVPDSYEKFSLDKDDIGTKFVKDGMNITLLDFRNDAATFLVENTNYKADYSYTYNINNDEEQIINDKFSGYGNYLFNKEYCIKPNESVLNEDKDFLEFSFDRLSISLADVDGKCIESQGNITDFRHYLWYRNHDMPFPELKSSYYDLKTRYIEAEKNTNYKFNALDVVTIRGLGKIKKVNFFLRSKKGKVHIIDLGEKIAKKEAADIEFFENRNYSPISKIDFEELKKELKVGLVNIKDDTLYYIYASLPSKYSLNSYFNFDEFKLKNKKNDSLSIERYRDLNNSLIFNNPKNIIETFISKNTKEFDFITGTIEVSITNFNENKIDLKKSPKGYVYDYKTNTLNLQQFDNFSNELFGFENSDKKNSIPFNIKDTIKNGGYEIIAKFKKKPSIILIRTRKEDNNFTIPFKLEIPKED